MGEDGAPFCIDNKKSRVVSGAGRASLTFGSVESIARVSSNRMRRPRRELVSGWRLRPRMKTHLSESVENLLWAASKPISPLFFQANQMLIESDKLNLPMEDQKRAPYGSDGRKRLRRSVGSFFSPSFTPYRP